jgi:putative transcriptional regulator
METLRPPYFLIATPLLSDPNFSQTVVLMAHHDQEGAMGWVLNRIHERPARALLTPTHRERVHAETPLHLGGPVPTQGLMAVFRAPLEGVGAVEMAPGINVSSSPDALPFLFSQPPDALALGRLIYGYAGWGPGQLEREMEEGGWLVLPYEVDLAFGPQVDDLWQRAFARLGINPALLTMSSGRRH